jgi:uncharacterized protein YciI
MHQPFRELLSPAAQATFLYQVKRETTMLFAIMCLDAPDALGKRAAVADSHRAHLNAPSVPLKLAGPLVGDDGQTSVGSLFIVDAPNRAAAEAFNRADPFHSAGVWAWTEIHAFIDRTPPAK